MFLIAPGASDLALASLPFQAHGLLMVEIVPFAVKEISLYKVRIETDPLNAVRYRWSLCEGDQVHLRSPHSYATRREAEADAKKALARGAKATRHIRP